MNWAPSGVNCRLLVCYITVRRAPLFIFKLRHKRYTFRPDPVRHLRRNVGLCRLRDFVPLAGEVQGHRSTHSTMPMPTFTVLATRYFGSAPAAPFGSSVFGWFGARSGTKSNAPRGHLVHSCSTEDTSAFCFSAFERERRACCDRVLQ